MLHQFQLIPLEEKVVEEEEDYKRDILVSI